MNYKEYSCPKRNMNFVLELMSYIVHTCSIKTDDLGLSIGSEDNIHENALVKLCFEKPIILNDKEKYLAFGAFCLFLDPKWCFIHAFKLICNEKLLNACEC